MNADSPSIPPRSEDPQPIYVGRFAPSPTGPLHAGSLFAAVISWLDARSAGGQWLLRIEDLDPPRVVPGATDAIMRTLEAFGLHWDGDVVVQSERDDRYADALAQLAAQDLLFHCDCSRRDLRAHGGVYPGTCRARGLAPTDAPSAVRARIDAEPVTFVDRAVGRVTQDLVTEVGDFVVRRRDGLWAYQLAVVVDDGEAGITDVVRGLDLLDSTPRQIWLQRALGLPTPRYLHHGLLVHPDGVKLSKQTGAPGVTIEDAATHMSWMLDRLALPHDPAAPPAEQLTEARSAWSVEHLPRSDLPAPG